jgi:hypothetical protein
MFVPVVCCALLLIVSLGPCAAVYTGREWQLRHASLLASREPVRQLVANVTEAVRQLSDEYLLRNWTCAHVTLDVVVREDADGVPIFHSRHEAPRYHEDYDALLVQPAVYRPLVVRAFEEVGYRVDEWQATMRGWDCSPCALAKAGDVCLTIGRWCTEDPWIRVCATGFAS